MKTFNAQRADAPRRVLMPTRNVFLGLERDDFSLKRCG